MTIWRHTEDRNLIDSDLMYTRCRFCRSEMITKDVRGLWADIPADIKYDHNKTVRLAEKISGYSLHADYDISVGPYEESASCNCCPTCGWWHVSRTFGLSTYHQSWEMIYGASGALRNLKCVDISKSVSEIKNYLVASYKDRFSLHPRRLEEIVTSIFKSGGYRTELTSFSNDGGIDIFLWSPKGEVIGVQVKRYVNRIEIEQVRSFTGALVLSGLTRGIFVTTSKFQSGAKRVIDNAAIRGIQMELIDAEALYEMLKLSQTSDTHSYPDFLTTKDPNKLPHLRFCP
jgi:restriction system protein